MLAIMGHILEFSDMKKIEYIMDVAYSVGFSSDSDQDQQFPELAKLDKEVGLDEAKLFQKKMQKDLKPQKRSDEDQGENLIAGSDIGLYVSRRQTIVRTKGESIKPRTGYYGKSPRSNYRGRRNI
jgi:hypothetical protein